MVLAFARLPSRVGILAQLACLACMLWTGQGKSSSTYGPTPKCNLAGYKAASNSSRVNCKDCMKKYQCAWCVSNTKTKAGSCTWRIPFHPGH
jgi:hypothetical protein